MDSMVPDRVEAAEIFCQEHHCGLLDPVPSTSPPVTLSPGLAHGSGVRLDPGRYLRPGAEFFTPPPSA